MFISDCVTVAVAALPVYEYLITLGEEVELVWRRKMRFSVSSALLVSTRICMVISAILAATPTPSACTGLRAFNIFQAIIYALGYIQVALFSALRISGLYGHNTILSVAVLVLNIVPVGTNIFGYVRRAYIQDLGVCIEGTNIPDALARRLVLISRIPVIIADVLVLILTWAKTYQQILYSQFLTGLVRDGTLYFLALLTINIVEIATHRTRHGVYVSIVLVTLPPILINRFMVNLHHTGSPMNTIDTQTQDPSPLSTLGFQLSDQTIGSMDETF